MSDLFSIEHTTLIMQYFLGGLMALLPAVIWGYVFYRKSPENRQAILVSFLTGALSVLPMFVWQHNWDFSLSVGSIHIPNLNIYNFIRTLSSEPSLGNFLSFTAIAIAVSLLIYIAAAIIIFFADLLLGMKVKTALKNVFRRSLEEPLIFISTGFLTGVGVVLASTLLSFFASQDIAYHFIAASFWTSIMIGFLEEYSKHLVVRFSSDNTIYSINSAIEFSIIVGLGFAFLENILYFVERIWLAPCTQIEIANNQCLFNPATGIYYHQVGILLIPFVFRSILSTLAHLVFSGIFGYFYGIAHFATYELQEMEKQRRFGWWLWRNFQKLFRLKSSVVFHEMKMLEGLFYAMVFHGLFDFALDQEKTFITVPMIFLGYAYLSYLFQKTDNQKKLRLIADSRTSVQMQSAMNTIDLLQKFEDQYLKNKAPSTESPLDAVEKNVELLEAYEKMEQHKNGSEPPAAPKNP